MITGAGALRDAGGPPQVHRGRKGFLRRRFGHVAVVEEPNPRGDDAAPIGALDRVNRRIGVRGMSWTHHGAMRWFWVRMLSCRAIINYFPPGCRSGHSSFGLEMEGHI